MAEPADFLDLYTTGDSAREIVMLGHAIDDEGETEGSIEHVMPAIRELTEFSRHQLKEIGVLPWTLPDDVGDNPNAKYLSTIVEYAAAACHRVREQTKTALASDGKQKVFSFGGNHLRAVELPGVVEACNEMKTPLAILWLDAHPDANVPNPDPNAKNNDPRYSLTGNVHGMVSSLVHGRGPKELVELLKQAPHLDPHNILYVGINAPDNAEITLLRELGVRVITIADIDLRGGMSQVYDAIQEVNRRVALDRAEKGEEIESVRWWTELDADVMDDKESKGKVMPNESGLRKRELDSLLLWMGKECEVLGLGVSEVAPKKDIDGSMREIIRGSVARLLLGLPNVPYSKHMQENKPGEPRKAPEVIPSTLQRNLLPQRGISWKKFTGYVAGLAVALSAVIFGAKKYSDSRTESASRKGVTPDFVLESDKNWDRQFQFTGIAQTNGFVPLPFKGSDLYAPETGKTILKEYLQDAKEHPSMASYKLRQLYSYIYLATGKGKGREAWQNVRDGVDVDTYWALVNGYTLFERTVDIAEVKEYERIWTS